MDESYENSWTLLEFGWLLVIYSERVGESDYLQYGKQLLGNALTIGAVI